MSMVPGIILGAILLLIGGIVYWAWARARDRKKFFAQIELIPGAVKVKDCFYTITQGDLKIEARFKQGRRHARFILSCPAAAPASFQATSGRKWIGFIRMLGLAKGVPTADPDWDAKYYFDTNSNDWGSDYLTPERRQAIAGFFGPGFYSLELDGGQLSATWSPFSFKSDTSVDFVLEAMTRMKTLVTEIPPLEKFTPTVYLSEAWFDERKKPAWFAMVAILIVVGVMVRGAPIDASGLAVKGLAMGLALCAVFLAAALNKLGERAWFPAFFTRIGLPALVFFPLLGLRVLTFLNDNLDNGPAVERRAEVVSKSASRSDRSESYTIKVKSWGDGGTIGIEATKDQYERAVPNQSVLKMAVLPGRLGFEWIAAMSVETVYASTTPAVAVSTEAVAVSSMTAPSR